MITKTLITRSLFASLWFVSPVSGGESALTRTYQPLDGLGAGGIRIVEVWCHDWYGHSGQPTAINLISARNVPPSNSAQATADLNLASVRKLLFSCTDIAGDEPELLLAAGDFESKGLHGKEELLRASLECLRRVLPPKLRETELRFTASDEDREWMAVIITAFNAHDRMKPFFVPRE